MPLFGRADTPVSARRAGLCLARPAGDGNAGLAHQVATGGCPGGQGRAARRWRPRACHHRQRDDQLSHRRAVAERSQRRSSAGVFRRRPRNGPDFARHCHRCRAHCRTGKGTGRRARRSRKRDPEPPDRRAGAEGDQRGSAVGQRRVPVDQRGIADLKGRTAIAERGTDRAQRPVAGNAGSSAAGL